MAAGILTLSDATFDKDVESSSGLIVVDFWASWCGPCRVLAPVLDLVARQFAGRVRIGKLNVDENGVTAARYAIRSIPTLLFFRDGVLVDRVVGVASRSELVDRIERQLAAGRQPSIRSA